MPRRKAIDIADPLGDSEAIPPPGVSENTWARVSEIAQVLGNVSLALALVQVTDGERAPHDTRETANLMDAARALETRSFKRYARLRDSVGARIAAAKQENMDYVLMLSDLRKLDDDPDALVGKAETNGSYTED